MSIQTTDEFKTTMPPLPPPPAVPSSVPPPASDLPADYYRHPIAFFPIPKGCLLVRHMSSFVHDLQNDSESIAVENAYRQSEEEARLFNMKRAVFKGLESKYVSKVKSALTKASNRGLFEYYYNFTIRDFQNTGLGRANDVLGMFLYELANPDSPIFTDNRGVFQGLQFQFVNNHKNTVKIFWERR